MVGQVDVVVLLFPICAYSGSSSSSRSCASSVRVRVGVRVHVRIRVRVRVLNGHVFALRVEKMKRVERTRRIAAVEQLFGC